MENILEKTVIENNIKIYFKILTEITREFIEDIFLSGSRK